MTTFCHPFFRSEYFYYYESTTGYRCIIIATDSLVASAQSYGRHFMVLP